MFSYIIIQKKVHIFFQLFIISLLISILGCATTAKDMLKLSTVEKPAIIEPAEEIEIVKVDKQMVDVKHYGELGSSFSSISVNPGRHRIVIRLTFFREGSVFILLADLLSGRNYVVKYQKMQISGWRYTGPIWIEDILTGEKVSEVERNF